MLKHNSQLRQTPGGFTIVEMLIIAPIVLLTIGAFVTIIVNMTGEVLATRSSNVLAYNIQDSLSRIEADVKASDSFAEANKITPLSTSQGYDNAISGFNNVDATLGNMLILSLPITTGGPDSFSTSYVYLANAPNACNSPQLKNNNVMMMNVVYFVKNKTLWRRTLMPSNYQTTTDRCGVPYQQPSCLVTGGFCVTQDIRLLDDIDVSGFNLQYYVKANDTTAISDATNLGIPANDRLTALQSATTVGVSLNVAKTAAGRDVIQTGDVRATRVQGIPTMSLTGPNLAASTATINQIDLSWSGVSRSVNYRLQRATDAGFTANLSDTTVTGLTNSATGLTEGTTYYFRVAARSATTQGNWSTTTVATTFVMSTASPTLNITAVRSNTLKLTWSAVPYSLNFRLQRATDAGFTANLSDTIEAGSPLPVAALTTGTTYYFRVAAKSATVQGNWSSTATITTLVAQPASITLDDQELYVPWPGFYNTACLSWTSPTGSRVSAYYVTQTTDQWFRVSPGWASTTGNYTNQKVTPATPSATLQACMDTYGGPQNGFGGQVTKVDLVWP
ncbi:MAG: fibronectin type III domain-containing protein [Candidatus Saccharibacteria bacterium]